ncbi:putative disease resistance protein RGA1 [Triticum dicoccoides]|uniref:putative disease resistance protein RGA1 n=1 Tax=Triticum dicoccoides TaxID=85692 RepID=UPI0018913394|nr:putative disease resistance protein RGA1 [Triticum dicoccoides]
MAQAVVQNSCRKLRSAIVDEAIMRLNFTGDLGEMLKQLVAIDVMIPNVEDRAEVIDPDGEINWRNWDEWQKWPPKVEATAYRVCHMLEELQEMAVPAGEKMAKMLSRPEDAVVGPNKEEVLVNMKEIKRELMMLRHELRQEKLQESVQFDDAAEGRAMLQAPAATGREEDVEKILARLSACNSGEGPIILPILGKPGVGKATVATMVFDNVRFKCYSRIWINHSGELTWLQNNIISELSLAAKEEMNGHGSDSDDEMVYITKRLHKLLNGKKVLIVLHELEQGMDSTQVIVIATVGADTVPTENFGVQPYWVRPLSEEMCCKIIKQGAVRSQTNSAQKEDLEQITPRLAKLCEGLPLIAQLFGSVLQFKEYAEWPEMQHWRAFVTGPLHQSYRSMPPNMRLCIAYCVFVLDTERAILKEDLIHQWIALDLIEPSEVFSASQLAEQYLRRLLDMSLLQTTRSSRSSRPGGLRHVAAGGSASPECPQGVAASRGAGGYGLQLATMKKCSHLLLRTDRFSVETTVQVDDRGQLEAVYAGLLQSWRPRRIQSVLELHPWWSLPSITGGHDAIPVAMGGTSPELVGYGAVPMGERVDLPSREQEHVDFPSRERCEGRRHRWRGKSNGGTQIDRVVVR